MWELFDELIECDECGSVLGAPPKFTIPPPPRPPHLGEYSRTKCNEEDILLKAQLSWEGDICEAMPILDVSPYSRQFLQMSSIIAVFALLLVLFALISSLFIWKNKRKMQNFLHCKKFSRGPDINGDLQLESNHVLNYEDVDVHFENQRTLVMRHHYHVDKMLHGKGIHYPSGYPMTRSPPFLVSSSPGPDPYRSNDNVYEELSPGQISDGESDSSLHSDDEFAEDELSLRGECSFNKENQVSNTVLNTNVSVISDVDAHHSKASDPEKKQDSFTTMAASMTKNKNKSANNTSCIGPTATHYSSGRLLSGILRHTKGRNKLHMASARARCRPVDRERKAESVNDFNDPLCRTDANGIGILHKMYDKPINLMPALDLHQQHQHQQEYQTPNNHNNPSFHSLHQLKNSIENHSECCNIHSKSVQFYHPSTLENEVERRNRMKAPSVAIIYRERVNCPGRLNNPQPYYTFNGSNANSMHARTSSSSMERRNCVDSTVSPIESNSGYAEPAYNCHYNTCSSHTRFPISAFTSNQLVSDLTSGVPAYQDHLNHNQQHTTIPLYEGNSQLYSCEDSSFGSDSGYSQYTHASSIGHHDYDLALPALSTATRKISAALGFGRHRQKSPLPTYDDPISLKTQPYNQNQLTPEVISLNHNSASASGYSSASSQNNIMLGQAQA